MQYGDRHGYGNLTYTVTTHQDLSADSNALSRLEEGGVSGQPVVSMLFHPLLHRVGAANWRAPLCALPARAPCIVCDVSKLLAQF